MPMTPREMIKLHKNNGFEKVEQNGSHVEMKNIKAGRQTEVPYHSKRLKKGLEQSILKQAALKWSLIRINGGITYISFFIRHYSTKQKKEASGFPSRTYRNVSRKERIGVKFFTDIAGSAYRQNTIFHIKSNIFKRGITAFVRL